MEINILSKWQFDDVVKRNNITHNNLQDFKRTIFISIVCSKDEQSSIISGPNSIVLVFDDIIDDEIGKRLHDKGDCQLFSKEQAKQLYDFIFKNRHKSQVLVHCSAGISRSGAVGTFINDFLKKDYFVFKREHPNILPNPYVLRLLKEAANDHGL